MNVSVADPSTTSIGFAAGSGADDFRGTLPETRAGASRVDADAPAVLLRSEALHW